jgi:hypothetical protein
LAGDPTGVVEYGRSDVGDPVGRREFRVPLL